MEGPEFGAGEALAKGWTLFADSARIAIPAIVALSLLGAVSDVLMESGGMLALIPALIVSLYAQNRIYKEQLAKLGLIEPDHPANHMGGLFGVALLSNLGTALGLLFLVIPGIFVGVRWSIAAPALVARDCGVTEAMGASWSAIKGRFWTVLLALAAIYIPFFLAAMATGAVPEFLSGGELVPVSLVLNLISNIFTVFGWFAALAIYALIHQGQRGVADIFA